MRVLVNPTGLYTYPDASISCGDAEFLDTSVDTLVNPIVIIEVLSPSTELYDRVAKFRHYQNIQSLKEYVLISQTTPIIEKFARGPGGSWTLSEASGLESSLEIESASVALNLSDVYADIEFSPTPPMMRHLD